MQPTVSWVDDIANDDVHLNVRTQSRRSIMDTKSGVKRLAGLVVAASITVAGFGLVSTAQAATTDATITVTAKTAGETGASYTAYLIGGYESKAFDSAGKLASANIAVNGGSGVTAEILTAATSAAGSAAGIDAANPAGWVAANWLGYTTTPISDDTISAVSPYAGKLQVFASALAGSSTFKSATTDTATGTKSADPVPVDGTITFTGLDEGLYLIVDDSATTAAGHSLPIIVGTKAWNATTSGFVDFADGGTGVKPALGVAQLKNDATYVGKTIVGGGSGNFIGDEVEFEVTFAVPTIPAGKATWSTTITDTFPTSLDLPNAADVKIFAGSDTTDIANKLPGGSISKAGQVLTIANLENLFATKTANSSTEWENVANVPGTTIPVPEGTVIRIRYKAVINSSAEAVYAVDSVTGLAANTNTVKYDNPEHTAADDSTDTAVAYTFGIELEKVDKAAHATKLEGAKFTVAKASAPSVPLKFTETGSSNGVYRYDTGGSTELVSRSNGLFKIYGIEAGEYIFTETAAPSNYYAVSSFKVTISPTYAPNSQTVSSVVYVLDGSNDTWLTNSNKLVTVGDTKNTLANLPYTGGIGIAIFLIVGAAITIIGVRAHRQSAKAETAAAAV
jgi:fimbrial isopeptide formation D2 family protein